MKNKVKEDEANKIIVLLNEAGFEQQDKSKILSCAYMKNRKAGKQ